MINFVKKCYLIQKHALYEATKLQIDLAMQLKQARIKKNMTQEDVAKIMHTHKPAISRLEAGNEDIKNFPSLLTLVKFSSAIGYELKVALIPIKRSGKQKVKRQEK
jgi:transcriptional regulator with XRE-family HTH domain